jgi:hypothetical protein
VLTTENSDSPLRSIASAANTTVLEPYDYRPGLYRISVRDAYGAVGAAGFAVVGANEVPPLSGDDAIAIQSPETQPDLAAALDAARLMEDPSGVWHFEAYQRVIGHEEGSALAKRIVYELQLGG